MLIALGSFLGFVRVKYLLGGRPRQGACSNPPLLSPNIPWFALPKKSTWTLTTNHAFERVIQACRQPRAYTDETWIGDEMVQAYTKLHELGVAVSVEVWQDMPLTSPLIGGLYGLSIGAVFCGESMFHRTTDASKVAFWGLMAWCQASGMALVDCQLENPHLMSLGAELMDRRDFLIALHQLVQTDVDGLGGQKLTLSASTLAASYGDKILDDRQSK